MNSDAMLKASDDLRPLELTPSAAQALLQLLVHGAQPRVQLAESLGLSRAQLTRVTADLIRRGVVVEGAAIARETRGRPAETLHARPAAAHFVGVKLTGTEIYFVLVDLAGTIVYESERALATRTVDEVVTSIRELLAAAIAETGIYPVGVGVAAAGDVVQHKGRAVLERSSFLGWDAVPLGHKVEKAVSLPTTVVNDVNALAGAYHWFGAGAPESMVVCAVGAGIGFAVVVGGEVISGANGRAGRVGHDLVGPGGQRCVNGHTECVHSFVTMPSIEANAGVGPGEYELALSLAREGNPRARKAFRDAATALGVAIASAVNVLDPNVITIMGEGVDMLDLEGREFRRALAERLERGYPDEVSIARPPFHFDLYARGAAVAAMRELFS